MTAAAAPRGGTVVLIAKECAPGRVKTRMHPPLTLDEAAELAGASLADSLTAVRAMPATRRILFFDGDAGTVDAAGFDVVPQPIGGLDERLAAVFDLVDERMLLVGMDTPQLRPEHVERFFAGADPVRDAADDAGDGAAPPIDAWFGPASDGGFWALGLERPDGALLAGVPMSRADTGARQLGRLRRAGLTVAMLPELRDVDRFDDAVEVASELDVRPHAAFVPTVQRLRALVVAREDAGVRA